MDLTIQHLRSFAAVADEGSFTRAAARLHVTTPALSQQVALLERRIGLTLLRRGTRAVTLTDDGAALLPRARAALAAVDEIRDWASSRTGGQSLRIGVPDGWPILAPMLEAFTAHASGDVVLQRIGFSDGLDAVRDDRIDLAFVPSMGRPSGAGIEVTALWTEPRLLVVGARHRFADRDAVDLDETNGERFVSFGDPAAVPAWYVVPRPDGSTPRIDPIADSFEGILGLCAAGLAVHIVGAMGAASHQRADLRYVPIADGGRATTWLVAPKRGGHPDADAFVAVALGVVRAQARAFGIEPAA